MHSFRHTATSISYTCTTYTHCVHVTCTYTVEAHDKPDTRNACLLARAQPGMPAGVPAVHVRRGDRSARSPGRSLAVRRGGARQGGVGEGGITASQARWHADDNQVLHGPSKWCVCVTSQARWHDLHQACMQRVCAPRCGETCPASATASDEVQGLASATACGARVRLEKMALCRQGCCNGCRQALTQISAKAFGGGVAAAGGDGLSVASALDQRRLRECLFGWPHSGTVSS